jgi:group I intron endonuclease
MADAIVADLNSSGIYQIRNLANGKLYVGSAVHLARRWRQHQCELGKGRHNPKLQNAWKKHGAQSFAFEVIELVPDKEQLIGREQHFLDLLAPEYNVATTAGSNLGVVWSEETRDRMCEANAAVWQRPGHREKMSAAHMGYTPAPEHTAKIGDALRGRKLGPEHAAVVAANNAKRNRSPEHRQRMSEFWKGKAKTPEQNAKMAESKRGQPAHNRGKPMSEAQKAKQSAAMKAKYLSDPSFRERVSQATRAAMNRPDVKAKVSASRGTR